MRYRTILVEVCFYVLSSLFLDRHMVNIPTLFLFRYGRHHVISVRDHERVRFVGSWRSTTIRIAGVQMILGTSIDDDVNYWLHGSVTVGDCGEAQGGISRPGASTCSRDSNAPRDGNLSFSMFPISCS